MKNVYYICNHFTELVEYHELCLFFQKSFPEIKQHLVFVENNYFSFVKYEDFLKRFDSIIRLPVCECAYTNRWYYELLPWKIFKRLNEVRVFLKEKNKFVFEEDSLCIISELTETTLPLRLLIRKFHTETKHSKICRIGTCYHRSEKCKTNNRISWLLHNVYTMIGAYPVSVHFYGWMVGERRFYDEKEIIDHFFVFSNKTESHADYIEIKYPLIKNIHSNFQQKKYVLFFDDGLGWANLVSKIGSEQWIITVNQILQAITNLYKDEKVTFLLKAHPANKKKIPYEFAGFEICGEDVTAEMIFSLHKEKILAVYSIASTAARSASLYGINSYVFYEMFEFPEEIMDRNKRYLLDFSDVVNIKNLDKLRLPHSVLTQTDAEDLEQITEIFKGI